MANFAAGLNNANGEGLDSHIFTTFTGGTYVNPSGTTFTNVSTTANPNFTFTNGLQSITSTLFSANEQYNLYLSTYQALTVQLTFKLADSSGNTLQMLTLNSNLFSMDNSHYYGDESFLVNNAVAGNILTISEGNTGSNVGLNSITVDAVVPEPSGFVLMALFLGAVLARVINRVWRFGKAQAWA